MSSPAPWTDIGRHALMPEAGHDEAARFDVVAQLNTFLAGRLAPAVRDAYEGRARHAFRMRHGHEPRDRREVAEAMSRDQIGRAHV